MEPTAARCRICRRPRPEDAEYCAACAAAMAGVETDEEEDEEEDETAADAEARERTAAPAARMEPGERRLRLCELALVVGTGYLWSTVGSLADWWAGNYRHPSYGGMNEASLFIHAVVAISVLAYVLNRQGRDLSSIGVTARWSDIPLTLVLWFFYVVSAQAVGRVLHPFFPPSPGRVSMPHSFWLWVLPSAAAEELIVRAYLITEVAELSGNVVLAVFVSTVFQTLYHLYQGPLPALMAAASFFVASVFYAGTRRITPVILVHTLFNVWVFSR